MKNIKYRVIQTNTHRFNIQIYTKITTGFWIWRKEFWIWRNTNSWGGSHCYEGPVMQPCSGTFKTLNDARNKVKEWTTKSEFTTLYHSV